ncbi:MAG: hydantoinase/oxoprolinase family protein [Chromatiales bacterium]
MPEPAGRGIIGWDIGGAHLKFARCSTRGRLADVRQYPCPLWQGLEQLDALLEEIAGDINLARHRHAVTMTGELVDIFPDRRRGVLRLLALFLRHVEAASVRVYTASGRLRSPAYARQHTAEVASANWHATAALVGQDQPAALLVDIGSTTTDLVPIHRGRVAVQGWTDAERLRCGELLYTGVVRTPLMTVAAQAPFEGEWQPLAAEIFATTGDVYVLTGRLQPKHYQSATADGAGVTPSDCARRLARTLGRDIGAASLDGWRRVARYFAAAQADTIRCALERILSRRGLEADLPVIGAGCGRFLARELTQRLGHTYMDIADVLGPPPRIREMAAVCAPAVAVAKLMAS